MQYKTLKARLGDRGIVLKRYDGPLIHVPTLQELSKTVNLQHERIFPFWEIEGKDIYWHNVKLPIEFDSVSQYLTIGYSQLSYHIGHKVTGYGYICASYMVKMSIPQSAIGDTVGIRI